MSDFISPFWHWYVAVISLVSILACAVLLLTQSKARPAKGEKVDLHGHVWDEDLSEYNNPLPKWWMWLFYITIAFALVYLAVYPGLGNFGGQFNWSSTGAYDAEIKQANTDYGPLFDKYAKVDVATLSKDPQANAMGQRLFLTYCIKCHGSDAGGAKGFPNLRDKDWLYGGEPDIIKTTIMHGRNGQMPPMGAALGSEKDVENVAHYVLSLSGSTSDPVKSVLGKAKFGACMACHGADAKGNQMLGSPNLTDKIWLYGGSADTIMETVRTGRNNTMPAFSDFLGESKVHVLSAYVWSLSNPQTPVK